MPNIRRDFFFFVLALVALFSVAALSSLAAFCFFKSCSVVEGTDVDVVTFGSVFVFSVFSKTSLGSRLRL